MGNRTGSSPVLGTIYYANRNCYEWFGKNTTLREAFLGTQVAEQNSEQFSFLGGN